MDLQQTINRYRLQIQVVKRTVIIYYVATRLKYPLLTNA